MGTKTIYLYDQWGNLIGERDTEGNFICDYVWANGRLVAKIDKMGETGGGQEIGGPPWPPIEPDSDIVYYYHLDHLGTPLVLTSKTKNIQWAADYLPFGDVYNQFQQAASNEIRFPGQYDDKETGLYYNWHRYYEPTLGRYYQADPLGQLRCANLYSYVANNPLKWVDPKGLQIFRSGSYGYPILDLSCVDRVATESYQQSLSSGLEGVEHDNTPWNSYLHCLWSCESTRQCGWLSSLLGTTAHEFWYQGTVPYVKDIWSSRVDLHNNAEGRACARKKYGNTQNCKYTDCDRCCRDKLMAQELIVLPK